MPIRDEGWPNGTPSLISLPSPAPRTAAEPYANLLGWQLDAVGDLVVARVLGRPVAVFARGTTSVWTTHLVVDDIYVATSTAQVAGATMSPPVELVGEGSMSFGTDPSGAGLGFWEPSNPASAVGEPGTLLWSELLVHDLDAATRFYDIAMDLSVVRPEDLDRSEEEGPGADEPYATLHTRDGELVARIGVIGAEFPPDVPSHWMPYVQVTDVVETLAVGHLYGFEPILDPTDSDFGRIAIVRGPRGEALGLMELG